MNPDGLHLIGTHNPVPKIHNLMVGGNVGDQVEVKIGGVRYTVILARDMVLGVKDAVEVVIQKSERQDPTYLFTDDEVRRARRRAVEADVD